MVIAIADLPKNPNYLDQYNKFQQNIEIIKSLIGKITTLENLPISYNIDGPSYSIDKNNIHLYISCNGGRLMGGHIRETVTKLADIHIVGPNEEIVVDYCNKCGFKFLSG